MKRLRFERKEVGYLLLSLLACGGVLWAGAHRSRFGSDFNALTKRVVPLHASDEALLAAVKADDLRAVQVAIQSGADVNCQSRTRFRSCTGPEPIMYYTPLIYSAMDPIRARFARGGKPKRPVIMRYLLEHGADPNLDGSGGETALSLVSGRGDLEAVRLLLDAGADVDKCPAYKGTPLGDACYGGHLDVAKLLREKGASVNQSGGRGVVGASPLHEAVGYADFPETARWLIEQGADVNARDNIGRTPLQWAAEYGRAESVRLLMGAGADPTMQDSTGKTALDIARGFSTSIIGTRSFRGGNAKKDEAEMIEAMEGKRH